MKIVLITGANRGIGLEIARQLDEKGCKVILCSRDLSKGLKAAINLSNNVIVKQLDVTNDESISKLNHFVSSEFGKLDVLINNAGIGANMQENNILSSTKQKIKNKFGIIYRFLKILKPMLKNSKLLNRNIKVQDTSIDRVKRIMDTNFYGPWRMINSFIPLLKKSKNGKIINISSEMGSLSKLTGIYPGYSLSKNSLNAITIMFSNELKNYNISVNAVCPGWVKTEMGGPDAPLSVFEGADTPVWLTLNDDIPTGKFFKERQIINW